MTLSQGIIWKPAELGASVSLWEDKPPDFSSTVSSSESLPKKSLDVSYLVKHAEEHGRSEQENPWSVRQMGVYHQMNAESGDIFIILNPSKTFQRRLKRMQQGKKPTAFWDLHMMLLTCAMEKWRWCATDAERRYVSMVCLQLGFQWRQRC